ncbi:MAG: hypothetical protein HQ546_02635 [Planctomycetes bacterium]|nr:hypothetical protein [Planctomycetota bacterium]
MNSRALVRERRNPHRTVGRDPRARPGPNDIHLGGRWNVRCTVDPAVDQLIVEDVSDFLRRMGIDVVDSADRTVSFETDPTRAERDCVLTFDPVHVGVGAGGISGAWTGVAWLEFEMRMRRGPFLPRGRMIRRAAWSTQISQGPWGGNYSVPDFSPEYLDDNSFRLYAHYGVNSMMIYGDLLCYTNSVVLPELNHPDAERHLAMLKDAAQRAARYGVRFSYVPVTAKLRHDHPVFIRHPETRGAGRQTDGKQIHCLCTSEEKVLAFLEEQFYRLFASVPELAGTILIVYAESFYHCRIWPSAAHRCPRCDAKCLEDVIVRSVTPVYRAVQRANQKAYVAVWAYNWGASQAACPQRDELFRRLPAGVRAFHQLDKDQSYHKQGYVKSIWDYSIDFVGASDTVQQIARVAAEVDRPLMVKTETGIGLETIQFPYVPAMQRLAQKWEAVRALKPVGVHQSWLFFGMFNSRAESLGLWAAYAKELPAEEFLRRLAICDFGPDAAEAVLTAWQHMSTAMGHLPVLQFNYYYIGPSFLGPCHPLVPDRGQKLSSVFDAFLFYLQETGETFAHKHIEEARSCLAIDKISPACGLPQPLPSETRTGLQIFIDEYTLAADESRHAWECLRQAQELVHTDFDKLHLREETLLVELVYRTNLACANTAKFLTARDAGDRAMMEAVAREERRNALDAIPLYEQAPWLDFNLRIDGRYSMAGDMIKEKVRMLDLLLKPEPDKPLRSTVYPAYAANRAGDAKRPPPHNGVSS